MNGPNDAGYNLGNRRAAALRSRNSSARDDDNGHQHQ